MNLLFKEYLHHRSEIAWDSRRPDNILLVSHFYYYELNDTPKQVNIEVGNFAYL